MSESAGFAFRGRPLPLFKQSSVEVSSPEKSYHWVMLDILTHTWNIPCQDIRPRHVGGALEERLAPGVCTKLELIKQKVQAELNGALSHCLVKFIFLFAIRDMQWEATFTT